VAAVADTAVKVARNTANAARDSAKAERAATARAKRLAAREAAGKTTRRAKAPRANARTTTTRQTASRKNAEAPRAERTETMNSNTNGFAGLNGMTGFAPFQKMFADAGQNMFANAGQNMFANAGQNLFAGAGERSQDVVRRGQKAAEDMADITRSNVEAIVESGRLATEGARSIGQDVVARGRQGVEQAADAIRTLAEAKSPTEFVQLQSELARTSFDRMVAETSRLTESMVKLAGEAFQPLSNRASANVQRINTFVA
jgi:phasin family protein